MKIIVRLLKNPFFILACIAVIFFWQVFTKGLMPFPGDLLLSEYNPWRHTSYFGYVEGSIPNKAQYFDVIRELYPWKTLVIDQFKKGQVPLWNPYNFSGSPLMANYQSQVWYPLGLLYLVLPQPIAWTVLIVLQTLLGSIFMYLFGTSIGLTATASVLAAVLFNYSSFASVWLEFNTVWHTIMWIPLILYLIELRIKHSFRWPQQLLFVFALFSSMTAGHPQDFIHSFLFIVTYSIARILFLPTEYARFKKSIIVELGLLTVFTFIMGAVQILPTIQLFLSSARIPHDVNYVVHTMLIQLWQLPITFITDFFGNPATRTYVLPDTYVNKSLSIGVIGFMLALISLTSKKSFHAAFFMVISAVVLVLTTNNPFSQIFYRFPVPLLSTGTPTRSLFIYIFSISILAAVGFDSLRTRMHFKRPLLFLCALLAIIFVGYILNPTRVYPFGQETVHAMKKTYVLALAIITAGGLCILSSKKFPVMQTGLLLLAALELFAGFTKFNPFVPPEYIFPPNEVFTYVQKNAGIERFWGYGTAQIEANFATQYHIYSPDGTDPLNLKWYNAFIQMSDDGNLPKIFTRSTRSDAYVHSGYGIKDLPQNLFRLRVLDTLGVRYILDRDENPKDANTFDSNRFRVRWHEKSWTIYENLLAAPRYFLTTQARYYTTDQEFERLFFDPAFNPQTTILLKSDDRVSAVREGTSTHSVDLVSYTPNEVQFRVTTDIPQFLFLSDTYDNGWKSFIDDQPAETLIADYALRAVAVPKGKHAVRMTYAPHSYILGVFISVAGVLLYIAYLIYGRFIPKNENH